MTNWVSRLHLGSRISYLGDFSIVPGYSGSKGSWYEHVSSISKDVYGLIYQYRVPKWSGYFTSFDLGIGTSGSEQSLIEEFVHPTIVSAAHYGVGFRLFIPFFVPAGSNIHGRGRSSKSSDHEFYGDIFGVVDNPIYPLYSQHQWMNVAVSTPKGRDVDPGAVVDTYGAWADVSDGPLGFDAKYVQIMQTSNDVTRPSYSWTCQLAVGGSGSEQVIATWKSYTHSSSDYQGMPLHDLNVNIPSGSTLRHRAKCTGNTAGDRIINLSYHFYG